MMEQLDIQNLVRENIRNISPYASAREEFTKYEREMIYLDANENPFKSNINRYPDPHQKEIKELLSKRKNIPVENILIGNGSDEILDLIFRAFCEPKKDNVLILPPTYGMYKVLASINDIAVKEVSLSREYQPKVEKILKESNTYSKILFLCSPNNPTGNSFDTALMEKLIRTFKGIVVLDEAYIDFSSKNSWTDRWNEFPNLIITQTASKAYGMAGVRLGIGYAAEQIIRILKNIKPPYNVSTISQRKMRDRLQEIGSVQQEIQEIKRQRFWLENELLQICFIKKIYPSEANFLLIKVDDASLRYTQLLTKGIVVRNRTKEVLCNNCLRITVGTKEENQKLMQVLNTI
ncbi:histidinol-phosphate transaminase [Tenacibaculum maritimum]|uniref:histidinol-phosphate transaminase n=1 Tax=Tenacibaculum maritimum TaxID=107401 RepID=UPI00293E9371|nr:histidinol-phosphate transaminase [Tenacibaculum maritimum]